MRLTRKDWTDERAPRGIEQHGMAGLSNPNLFNHRKKAVEPIGRFDGADDCMLPVVKDRDRNVDGFFRRPERSFLGRNQSTDIGLINSTCFDRFPPRLVPKIEMIRLGTRSHECSMLIRDQQPDNLISVTDLCLQEKAGELRV